MEKKILLQREIYDRLKQQFLFNWSSDIIDMYDGHNHANRRAENYAIRNTISVWRAQYGK